MSPPAAPKRKTSSLLDTRVIFCGDNLQKLADFPDASVDLIYIDPPFNSNRNYEVFWGETREKRSFEDRHASTPPSIARQIVAATLSGLARGTEGGTANLERLIANIATPGGITEAGIRFLDKARVEDILNAMVVHCLARIGSIREQFTSASVAR